MRNLYLYRVVSGVRWLSYRGKILAAVAMGSFFPFLVLIGLLVAFASANNTASLAIAFTAGVVGIAAAIWATEGMLRPIALTSAALRAYRTSRKLPALPTHFTDDASSLMADTVHTLARLDGALVRLARYDEIAGGPNRGFLPSEAGADRMPVVTERELKRAVAADQLQLHLQPVIDLNLGRAAGAEALIRWQHPQRGLLLPSTFLPLAKANGLSDAIGRWVVRNACAQLAAWTASNDDGLGLSINLSAHQFLDPEPANIIAQALQNAGVSPDRLEVELSETIAMRDRDVTAKIFGRLRDHGVRVAIDDFGAGYSSLIDLRTLPFDKLKIERGFVSGVDKEPDLQAMSSALVTLARGLGAKVVATGAEREDEVRFLYETGCSVFQGFYFAKPERPTASVTQSPTSGSALG